MNSIPQPTNFSPKFSGMTIRAIHPAINAPDPQIYMDIEGATYRFFHGESPRRPGEIKFMNHALQVKDDPRVSQLSGRIHPTTTPPESEIRQILTEIINGMELSREKQPLTIDGYSPDTFLKKYKTKILDAIRKNRIDVVNTKNPKKLHISLSPVKESAAAGGGGLPLSEVVPKPRSGWQGDVFSFSPKSQ